MKNPKFHPLAGNSPYFCDRCGTGIRHTFRYKDQEYGSECIHTILEQGYLEKAIRQCERKLNPPNSSSLIEVNLACLIANLQKLTPSFTIHFKSGGKVIIRHVDWENCKLQIEEWPCADSSFPKVRNPTIAQFAWKVKWI